MRLVTWNTQWCRGLDGLVSAERIVAGARALADFDVLCLQEIAHGFRDLAGDASADQSARIAALLPGFSVFYGAAVDGFTREGRRRRFGNLIATRLPVAQVRHHPLPYPADAGVRSMPRMCTEVTVHAPGLGPLRIMTTHLEYFSKVQRMAQARALRAIHIEATAQALAPPAETNDGSPFETRMHTTEAVLCGDFNLRPSEPEHAAIEAPFELRVKAGAEAEVDAGVGDARRLRDAWSLVHGEGAPRTPTFCVHDSTYSPEPIACDFVFVSDGLAARVREVTVDSVTQASDHQPVAVRLE